MKLSLLFSLTLSFVMHANLPYSQKTIISLNLENVTLKEVMDKIENYQSRITGTITDTQGQPLPGASIVEKGTTNGTQSDFDGNFTLQLANDNAILLISYIGFTTKEVSINGQTTLTVSLEESAAQLDEIVLVGYGAQKKSDLTGSVVRVSTEKTANLANSNVLQAIQGQVPGINVTSGGGGTVGEDPELLIRGTNSLTASNAPLIVVDDVIYNGSISDFNSNDIESIDVLKDASATAVYGARAANGVLLITTKRGALGKPRFNFNAYTGYQTADKLVRVLDGPGYEQKIRDYNSILLNDNPNADPIRLTEIEETNKANGQEIDWIKESLRSGIISNYQINVSGASETTNYYISGAYFNQEGIVRNDDFNRLTLNLNISNKLTDWFTLGIKSTYVTSDLSGQEANLDQAYRQSPYGAFYDENGPGGFAQFPIGDALGFHPFIPTLILEENKRNSLRGVLSSQVEIPFIPGLKWTMNYGANIRNAEVNSFTNNQLTTASQTQNGIARKASSNNFDWTLDNILNYNRTYALRHSLDLTLLVSRESRRLDQTMAGANDFVSQELGFNSLGLGAVQNSDSNREEQNSNSQLGRVNYALDNKYAFTYTFRRDGFSAFSENNKYAIFQAGAFAWTVSNENFLKESKFLNYLKIRLSYGENGNQGIERFSSLSKISVNQYLYGNGGSSISTFGIESLANSDLTWETTLSRNIGLDFQLFNNRVSGSVDAYLSNTEDLLQLRSIPTITGFKRVLTNVGEVENKGLEFSLNTKIFDRTDFAWDNTIVFSTNRNKIVSLGGVDADGDGREDDDISNGWFIGEPVDAIYGYKTDGIYQLGDQIPDAFREGDFRLVDVDGSGDIGPEDRQILGVESPKYAIAMGNTFRYKGFSLYVLINSLQGGGDKNYFSGDNFGTRSVNRRGFTTFTERFNVQGVPYWTANNPTNDYPRLDYIAPFDHPILEDRSFIRIQDISLAYDFDGIILDKLGVSGLKLYTSIKNLHTFTNWSGYNPETASTIQDLPFLQSITIGINFNF